MPKKIREVRLDINKQVDDVAISGDLFRMERMDKNAWWIAVYEGQKRVCFWLKLEGNEIVATLTENDLDAKVE